MQKLETCKNMKMKIESVRPDRLKPVRAIYAKVKIMTK